MRRRPTIPKTDVMVNTIGRTDAAVLPSVPRSPLSYRQQLKLFTTIPVAAQEILRDAGGTLTRVKLVPRWVGPEFVFALSPSGARCILGEPGRSTDRTPIHDEVRSLLGDSLFTVRNDHWVPRKRALQPVFMKPNVRAFGGHMAQAAQTVVAGWADGQVVDLDASCRRLTLRALGRSVLGIDLDELADSIGESMHTALTYITARAMTPFKPPHWLPTPGRHRARAAAAHLYDMAAQILRTCRDDPGHDAPLVRSMMAATDPDTGQALSDAEICADLVIFMLAGHDTTATTLTYALWALGRHPDLQARVRAEAHAIGDREITPDDLPGLTYTVQVIHEALRLFPPGPANHRLITQDMEVDGHLVKAGTVALVGIYAMHRDPALWEHPLEFDPDRFNPEQSKGRDRWQYIPFSAGPRTCIGDHFAMLEATLALATIVRHTEVQSLHDVFPPALPFTMTADGPIHARVRSV